MIPDPVGDGTLTSSRPGDPWGVLRSAFWVLPTPSIDYNLWFQLRIDFRPGFEVIQLFWFYLPLRHVE